MVRVDIRTRDSGSGRKGREEREEGKGENTYGDFGQILDIRLRVHAGFGELE